MLLLLVSVLGGKNVLPEAGLFLEKWRAAASVLGNEEEFVGLPQNGGYNLATFLWNYLAQDLIKSAFSGLFLRRRIAEKT